jgi:hypothetical protein
MSHNHSDHFLVATSFITEMQAMWALMVIMFAWNVVMTVQHQKLKNKVSCNCQQTNIG